MIERIFLKSTARIFLLFGANKKDVSMAHLAKNVF